MMLEACLYSSGKMIALGAAAFSISWTHSVEKTGWMEQWEVRDSGLVLSEARVKGSGAGMDPGEGARLVDGWWVWRPANPAVEELILSNSGATVSGWRICAAGKCRDTQAADGKLRIAACLPD